MYTVYFLYNLNIKTGKPKYSSDKKIYFNDPFFLHTIKGFVEQSDNIFKKTEEYLLDYNNKGKLIETVIASHLIRMAFTFFNAIPQFNYQKNLFFWKEKYELYFMMKIPDGFIPIEIKYRKETSKSDFNGLRNFIKIKKMNHGIVVTQDELKVEKDLVKIPAYLLLAIT